jgi:hypothetical protein
MQLQTNNILKMASWIVIRLSYKCGSLCCFSSLMILILYQPTPKLMQGELGWFQQGYYPGLPGVLRHSIKVRTNPRIHVWDTNIFEEDCILDLLCVIEDLFLIVLIVVDYKTTTAINFCFNSSEPKFSHNPAGIPILLGSQSCWDPNPAGIPPGFPYSHNWDPSGIALSKPSRRDPTGIPNTFSMGLAWWRRLHNVQCSV